MRPPEEVKRELVQQWLSKAEQDLRAAKHFLAEDEPLFEIIGFHAQQAAEKYLKALLVYHQIEFTKIHDLDKLLKLIARVDAPLAESLQDITVLTNYAVEIRYPGDHPEITLVDAQKAVVLAEKAREEILKAIPVINGTQS